jgi:CHAD domain-containing protein
VAESVSIGGERQAWRSRQGRPWLRLLRAEPDDLGPVSPELVLVDPPLAAAVRVAPDAVLVAERRTNGSLQTVPPAPPERLEDGGGRSGPATTTRYDTRDLLLERHGLKLELATRGSSRFWQLTAARGERVDVADDGSGVPGQIESLLRTVVREGELVEVSTRSSDPEIRRLEELVAKQHRSVLRHDVGTRIASDPESLHQVRVAARRVRTFLTVARELVDDEWAAEVNDGMRGLGRASNEARDVDILLDRVRGEIRSLDLRDRSAAEALIGKLEDDRVELQRALVTELDGERYQRVLDQLALPARPAQQRSKRKLDQLAARELRGLVSRVRKLGKRPPEDALHALRIKVKKVRYATELGGGASGKRARRVIEAATRMQDLLGNHQDAVVAEERLRTVAYAFDETGISFVAGRLAERESTRRDEIHGSLPPAWKDLRKLSKKVD